MLKKRLITAAFLLPLVVLGILFLPIGAFMTASVLVFLVAAWEWTSLSGLKTITGRIAGFLVISTFILTILSYPAIFSLFYVSVLIWCVAFLMVAIYPQGSWLYAAKGIGMLIGALILGVGLSAVVGLKAYNPYYLLYAMILVWVADTGAFFAGRRFGKHKLAAQVSPGKTWEGVLGALLLSSCVASIAYFVLDLSPSPRSFMMWMLLNIITVLFSIVGDLFESLFKRLRNLKDSGTLLPGHGGVLDRIDSLLAALPVFVAGLGVFL